jgi:hypothetical protein
MIASEMERRRIPGQALPFLEQAIGSVVGEELPKGLKTVSAAEAAEVLRSGTEDFVMKLPSKVGEGFSDEIFVPMRANQMAQFVPEVGKQMPQTLLASYMRVASKAADIESGIEGAQEAYEASVKSLRSAITKQWLLATESRGQLAGTSAPVAQSWAKNAFTTWNPAQHYESVEDLSHARMFRYGVGKQTAKEMFQDMLRFAPEEEKTGIKKAMKAFMEGQSAYGWTARHPLHYPYSIGPAEFQLVPDKETGVFYPKTTVGIGGKKVDISGALGQALDTDMDRPVIGFITNAKVSKAIQDTVNDSRFKKEYARLMSIQTDLEDISKTHMKASGTYYNPADEARRAAEGARKMAGIGIATPGVSVAAQELRMAASAAGAEGKGELSTFIAQLEQRAISAKHGGEAERISTAIKRFVSREGDPRREFEIAWKSIWGREEFVAGGVEFSMKQKFEELSGYLSAARASGETSAHKKVVRRAASAHRGQEIAVETATEIQQMLQMHRAGLGDANAQLVRRMQMGTGAGAKASRGNISNIVSKLKAAGNIAKRHWKYPALGLGAALAARYAVSPSEMDMPEPQHDQKATELAMGDPTSMVPPPQSIIKRIVTAAGAAVPAGMNGTISGDMSSTQTRDLIRYGVSLPGQTSFSMRDDRGSISPEFIRKSMDERYY